MHRWILPPLAFALFALIGPIKRGFGLDRAVPVAMVLWPALLLGLHVAMGRPLSLSAIDARPDHVARVLFLGASAAVLAAWKGTLPETSWNAMVASAYTSAGGPSCSVPTSGAR